MKNDLLKEEINIQKINIKEKNQEATLYYTQTDKFKTFSCGCIFFETLEQESRVRYELLSEMLDRTTKKHPKESEFIEYLYDLYDLSYTVSTSKLASVNTINFKISSVHSKYLHDDIDLFEEGIKILKEGIFDPNFDEQIFNESKHLWVEDLKNMHNNKRLFAYLEFVKAMHQGEKYYECMITNPKIVEEMPFEKVKETYKDFLKLPHIYYYVGEESLDKVIEKMSYFDFPISDTKDLEVIDKEIKPNIVEKVVVEEMDANQSILNIGYRTNIYLDDSDYSAMHLLNLMIGGFAHSDLFQIIREQYGLSYSVSSNYNPRKGIMIINCGIDEDKYELALKLIKEIINNYKKGNISSENLELTKKAVISAIKLNLDSIGYYITSSLSYEFRKTFYTCKQKIEDIEKVTLEDIKCAAKKLELDTVHLMKGRNNGKIC